MFVDLVKYLQDKLYAIAEGLYICSSERNIDANYDKNQVVVSALSGNVYEESATIPYQIDIITNDIESVMIDFTTLARDNNNVPFNVVVQEGENYQSYTIKPFFNTPVVMDKEIQMGSDKYARIVVFATINAIYNVNDIKSIVIDGEEIKFQNASIGYTTELKSNRVSGDELNRSKKHVASTALTLTVVNKSSVFFNKLFKINFGQLKGNTSFNVEIEMINGLKGSFKMVYGTGILSSVRGQLPSNQVSLYIYDDRGDNNA